LRVEDWLIAEKNAKLGDTALRRPIYFFLGDFSGIRDPARPHALVMPLAAFSPDSLTFTCSDSMTSHQLGIVAAEQASAPALHRGQVFTRSEIEAVIAALDLPDDHWKPGAWRDFFSRSRSGTTGRSANGSQRTGASRLHARECGSASARALSREHTQ
jgi:hypothetical protein